jgi:hypothetical protein
VAEHDISLERSDIVTRFGLEHRRKGLLWFPTYEFEFRGRYAFQNNTSEARDINMVFYLEKGTVIYDGFTIQTEDQRAVESQIQNGEAMWSQRFLPGEIRGYLVTYKSRGNRQLALWGPAFGVGGQCRSRSKLCSLHGDQLHRCQLLSRHAVAVATSSDKRRMEWPLEIRQHRHQRSHRD